MSGYLGARTQIADTGAYNREQADDLFPSKESVVAFSSTGTNTTMVKPPVYGIRVLEFTAATGTITLPDMSGQPGGGRFRILKNNATQGSVNINLSGTNVGIWGAVQLKLNADGDFWELQWTGSRFVLTDGHESGSNANGEYWKCSDGKQECLQNSIDCIGRVIVEYPQPFSTLLSFNPYFDNASDFTQTGSSALDVTDKKVEFGITNRSAGDGSLETNNRRVGYLATGRWYE